jgi:predicted enzyme related to lactoylglutathione lyase
MPEGEAVGWFRAVVVDADDHIALAAFWQRVLGVEEAVREQDWIQLGVGKSGAFLAFQPAAGPDRPAGMRLRPDIEVEDLEVARARVLELGGSEVRAVHEVQGGDMHYVMADPEGNEFCIVNPLPPELARHWPGIDG